MFLLHSTWHTYTHVWHSIQSPPLSHIMQKSHRLPLHLLYFVFNLFYFSFFYSKFSFTSHFNWCNRHLFFFLCILMIFVVLFLLLVSFFFLSIVFYFPLFVLWIVRNLTVFFFYSFHCFLSDYFYCSLICCHCLCFILYRFNYSFFFLYYYFYNSVE